MTSYEQFIRSKELTPLICGFDIDPSEIHQALFDYQGAIVKWAIKRGRAAVFGDTGNGKTPIQTEWSKHVVNHSQGEVLIAAPLSVAQQTIEMARELQGIDIGYVRHPSQIKHAISITNYEMLHEFDLSRFAAFVMDESSIIKHQDGKTRNHIIQAVQPVPYRLALTATPSPNDYMELGNHAEFLGIMKMQEMLAMFFTHDGGDTSSWVLKGHGKRRFWEWMATWAMCFKSPEDLGFDGSKHVLPELRIHKVIVPSEPSDGELFPSVANGVSGRNVARRESIEDRMQAAANLANSFDESVVTWCLLNNESDMLESSISGSVAVEGSDSIDFKEKTIHDFAHGGLQKLVSKPSIFGFGLNLQICSKTIFASIDDSFEKFYQAIKRFHRFGQKKIVDVYVVYSESQGPIYENIMTKWAQHETMQREMVNHMQEAMKKEIFGAAVEKTEYVRDVVKGDGFELHLADCVDLASEIETGSIDYTIFSPPFASLYTYSNSDRDMGNSKNHGEFYQHFRYLVDEMLRITRPGRLLSFHCMNLPTSKVNDGFIGIRDFRGKLIAMFEDAGWIFHSEVCIWKDPVTAMQRTKALGLLHKTIRKDSSMSRQGIPDYLVTMRKPGDNDKPIAHTHEDFPVSLWQRYASPVWFDINPSKTLNHREAKDEDDQKHLCPLQLEVIERAMELWTAQNDLVFSPFTGIGSEGWCALKTGRRFIGSELKPSYFRVAASNLADAEKEANQTSLFPGMTA